MGGFGSGNWYRWDKRDTVEGHRSLDVGLLHRNGLLCPGARSGWEWHNTSGDRTAFIMLRAEQDLLVLDYRVSYGGDWQDVDEPIPLTWTPCSFGGRRPWFSPIHCSTVSQGRKNRVLRVLFILSTPLILSTPTVNLFQNSSGKPASVHAARNSLRAR